MVKPRSKISILFIFLSVATHISFLLTACSSTNSKPLLVSFSADGRSIVFSNIDRAGLLHLNTIEANDSVLNDLVSVLQTPSESDPAIRELPVPGKLLVTDTNIVFMPERPFVKGRDYLVITYLNSSFGTVKDALQSELRTGVRPNQVILRR